MVSVLVNRDLCTRCGICSSICVMGVLVPASADSLPKVDPAAAGMCIGCGHCMAYCPSQALLLGGSPDEPAIPAGAGSIAPEDIGYFLKKRRSVRFYTEEPVSRKKVLAILDIARYAASGGNGQPVEWIVVHDPEKVQRIAGLTVAWMRTLVDSGHPMSGYVPLLIGAWEMGRDVICRGAPHLLAASIPENNPVAQTDAVIALTYFDVAAPAFGVGTCWAGFVAMAASAYPALQQELGLPKGRRIAYAMLFGYPRYTIHGIPPRKPLQVTWL